MRFRYPRSGEDIALFPVPLNFGRASLIDFMTASNIPAWTTTTGRLSAYPLDIRQEISRSNGQVLGMDPDRLCVLI